jgi:hypothetical protein
MMQRVGELEVPAVSVHIAAERAHPRWHLWHRVRWRLLLAVLCVLYIVAWGISGSFPIGTTDLEAFFFPSARLMLAGHPLQAYAIRYAGNYPNANGPLSLLPLTFAAAIAQRLGVLDDPNPRRAIVMVIFAIFPLLVSYEAMRAIDRVRGVALRGVPRLMGYAFFLLTPQLWHSMLFYGHIEQPLEIWLALLGIRLLVERHAGWAGLCMGLMLLTRSSALVLLIPLLVVLLCRRHWHRAVALGGVAALVSALGILPFWLGDRSDTVYSLVTFRTQLPLGGGSLWGLALDTPLQSFALAHDSLVVIATSALIALVAGLSCRSLDVDSRALYALLAVTSFCFPLLIKTMWPYYFIEPYVFVTLWWLSLLPLEQGWSWRRWRWLLGLVLPVGIVCIGVLGEAAAGQIETDAYLRAWSLAMSAAMLAVMGVVAGFGLVGDARPVAAVMKVADSSELAGATSD